MYACLLILLACLTSGLTSPTISADVELVDTPEAKEYPKHWLSPECLIELLVSYVIRLTVDLRERCNDTVVMNQLLQKFDFLKCKGVPFRISIQDDICDNVRRESFGSEENSSAEIDYD